MCKASFPWQGLNITIENAAGFYRSGTARDGHEWRTKIHFHYGYINKIEGNDVDHVDVFIGPQMEKSGTVFIVGGLIMGPLGAVVGGLSGVDKMRVDNKNMLVLNYWNTRTRKAESLIFSSDKMITPFVNRIKNFARENGWGMASM